MRTLSALVFVAALLRCGGPQRAPVSPASGEQQPPSSAARLIEALEAAKLDLRRSGTIQQPFFTPPAQVVIVEGNDLELFEYRTGADAAREVQRIGPGGAIGNAMPLWVQPPRFFHRGNLIAIYLGADARVLRVLTRELTPVATKP
jgi:hypothetical protein